jgi:hypothetical protein
MRANLPLAFLEIDQNRSGCIRMEQVLRFVFDFGAQSKPYWTFN